MQTIIRIEHPNDGKGLWCSKHLINNYYLIQEHSEFAAINKRHSDFNNFPNIWNDTKLLNQLNNNHDNLKDFHFAFLSLKQLRTALTDKELKECIDIIGFKVLMLDVNSCYTSKYQAIFKKESIQFSKDISSMFI